MPWSSFIASKRIVELTAALLVQYCLHLEEKEKIAYDQNFLFFFSSKIDEIKTESNETS